MQTRYYRNLSFLLWLPFILTECGTEDVTDNTLDNPGNSIRLNGQRTKQTRGAEEARLADLVGDLRLYGLKIVEGEAQSVFENYILWWNGAAGTTTTNAEGWEYVGAYTGSSSDVHQSTSVNTSKQSIKYWDFSATKYLFFGVAKAEKCNDFTLDVAKRKVTTTVSLSEADLSNSYSIPYFTQPVQIGKSSYQQTVTLPFSRLCSRVRVGFYETIPGYAVKELRFHVEDAEGVTTCRLCGDYAKQGTATLIYDLDKANGFASPSLTCDFTATSHEATYRDFGLLNYTNANDNLLTGAADAALYLGKFSSNATFAGSNPGYYTDLLPNPDNATPLTLTVDYTLVANDGSGHQMTVSGKTATVPAAYCRWQANYSYTYLFKINDADLQPITFVAYAEEPGTEDNHLGTITTVGEYSITTYQEGSTDTAGIDYVTNKEVEVTVVYNNEGNTPKYIPLTHTGMTAANAAGDPTLPTAGATGDYVIIYHQRTIHEWIVETGDEAISPSLVPTMGVYRETVERVNIGGDGIARFIPDVTGTYRVEYWHQPASTTEDPNPAPQQLAVKIVKIKGEGSDLELYDKWQNGSATNTTW